MKKKKIVKVLVHGIMGNPFAELKKGIELEGFEVVDVYFPYQDPRRADYQDPRLAQIGVQDKVNYLVNILERFQSEGREYDLIGHSAGALVSLLVASRVGIRPRKIILISPVGARGIFMIQPSVLWTFTEIFRSWGFYRKKVKLSYEKIVYSMLNKINSESERKNIYRGLCEESGRFIFEIGFWPFDSKKSTQVIFKNIACDVRILAGDEDRIAPIMIARSTLRRLKAAKNGHVHSLREFKGGAHWLFAEFPEEICQEICTK